MRFVLYRILGNDLPPRHRPGQTIDNLRFILDHEPTLPDCEKRWVVNRIADPAAEATALALIASAGHAALRIPFSLDEYARCAAAIPMAKARVFLHTPAFRRLGPFDRAFQREEFLANRNQYAINNNGARNAALAEGRRLADWVLPWDGGTFLTRDGWDAIRSAATQAGDVRYLIVPMARVVDNARLLASDAGAPIADQEPQIAFRSDAAESFDERLRYGRAPKASLLVRLGAEGPWSGWRSAIEGAAIAGASPDAGRCRPAGWVARLESGNDAAESVVADRVGYRLVGIVHLLRRLDERVIRRGWNPDAPQFFRGPHLGRLREGGEIAASLLSAADRLAATPFGLPTDKRERPAGAAPTDYVSLAPYWWPDPALPDGLPYRRRDGERYPPADALDSPSSDRARLRQALHQVVVLSLAAGLSRRRDLGEAAARRIRAWFVDPATAMRPHLRFAQVQRGHDERASGTGIVDIRDLPFALDGVCILQLLGALDATEVAAVRRWARELLDWLRKSPNGEAALVARNNIGTWYDVVVLALATFADRIGAAADVLERLPMRIAQQFRPDGAQPEEESRQTPGHYALFNLEAWTCLARLAAPIGFDPWSFAGEDGRSLRRAVGRIARRIGGVDDGATERRRLAAIIRLAPWPIPEGWVPDGWIAGRHDAILKRGTPLPLDAGCGLPPFWEIVDRAFPGVPRTPAKTRAEGRPKPGDGGE
ncbi:MAG: alginate lyase family protein [Alphaproteobacteria bacterium]